MCDVSPTYMLTRIQLYGPQNFSRLSTIINNMSCMIAGKQRFHQKKKLHKGKCIALPRHAGRSYYPV